MKTTLELIRVSQDGKQAIKVLVRNTVCNSEITKILKELGYKANAAINGMSIVCTTPQELDAARAPIMKLFKKESVNGVVEAI